MNRKAWALVVSHGLAAVGMSAPWPLLAVLVWDATSDSLLLGLTAAARMLPYVLLSWYAGHLADRWARHHVIRASLALRVACLALATLALGADAIVAAVVLCTAAIAAGTPAYPAAAAAMPGLAPRETDRATNLLVTVEVASFVVGPAIGGLALGRLSPVLILGLSTATVVLAMIIMRGLVLAKPARSEAVPERGLTRAVLGYRPARRAIWLGVVVNAVLAGLGILLLPHSEARWTDLEGFGVATAALGFGALAAPLVMRFMRIARAGQGLTWMGVAVLAAGLAPTVGWGVVPLVLVGAVAVRVESVATRQLQEALPDGLRGSGLGLADTAMVGAALLASFLAPALLALASATTWILVGAAAIMIGVRLVDRRAPAVTPSPRSVAEAGGHL